MYAQAAEGGDTDLKLSPKLSPQQSGRIRGPIVEFWEVELTCCYLTTTVGISDCMFNLVGANTEIEAICAWLLDISDV